MTMIVDLPRLLLLLLLLLLMMMLRGDAVLLLLPLLLLLLLAATATLGCEKNEEFCCCSLPPTMYSGVCIITLDSPPLSVLRFDRCAVLRCATRHMPWLRVADCTYDTPPKNAKHRTMICS